MDLTDCISYGTWAYSDLINFVEREQESQDIMTRRQKISLCYGILTIIKTKSQKNIQSHARMKMLIIIFDISVKLNRKPLYLGLILTPLLLYPPFKKKIYICVHQK